MGGFANYPSLEDRTVFITGGASGIGESLVEVFVLQKSRVAFIDLDLSASQALQKRLEDAGLQKPCLEPCDVRDIATMEKCLRNAALDLGPVSVLVNNAGNDERHGADEISVEYWDDRIAVNLRHQFFAAREVAREMKGNGGGSIINFGSIQAYLSSPGMSGYAVSKYVESVVGFTFIPEASSKSKYPKLKKSKPLNSPQSANETLKLFP